MRSQTQTIERTYSREEIKRIKEIFSELREASKNKHVQAYIRKAKEEWQA